MEFLSLSHRRSSTRNVPSVEERGETDVFPGELLLYVVVCVRVGVSVCVCLCAFLSLCFFFSNFYFACKRKKFFTCSCYCVRGTRTQLLISVRCSVHYWVFCAINKRGFFESAFVLTHVCLALRRLLTFCLTLTH